MKAKNHALAFFLSFIPGVGFIYVDRKVRGFLYGFTFFGLLLSGLALYFLVASGIPLLAAAGTAGLVFFIQMIDMTVFLVKKEQEGKEKNSGENGHRNERFSTLLLSLIPGLGHFHLGLMNRGLTFLIAAFGVGMMVIFIVIMTGQTSFIIFLGILMIIWIMNLFDIIHLLDRMDRGENIADRTILEDLEAHRDSGRKSRALALLLSVLPGAGHMYLGLQRRGLQLMAAFFLSVFLIDFMRIPLFMFFIPIIWFFSFFDAMQKVADAETKEIEDVPIVTYFVHKQRWIGLGLLLLGIYYLFDRVIRPELFPYLSGLIGIDLHYFYYNYVQVTIVCLILIGGGIRLMYGSKKKKGEEVS